MKTQQAQFYVVTEKDMDLIEKLLPDYFNDNENGGDVDGVARLVEVSHLNEDEQKLIACPIVTGTRIERYTQKALKAYTPEQVCAWPSSRIAYACAVLQ